MFNEAKFKKCINHLVEVKICIILFYTIIFISIGIGIGFIIKINLIKNVIILVISGILGAIIGLLIGAYETWRVEMKIQEAYWKIEILNELKKQSSIKNTPFAKTVVAIENNRSDK